MARCIQSWTDYILHHCHTRESKLGQCSIPQSVPNIISCSRVGLILPSSVSKLVDEECSLSILQGPYIEIRYFWRHNATQYLSKQCQCC